MQEGRSPLLYGGRWCEGWLVLKMIALRAAAALLILGLFALYILNPCSSRAIRSRLAQNEATAASDSE